MPTSQTGPAPPQPLARELYPFVGNLAGLRKTYGNQAILRMLNSSNASFPGAGVQRKCACGGSGSTECAGCQEKHQRELQRTAASEVAPPIVQDVLRSPGAPLDRGVRNFMEPRFGFDFSGVRVHADSRAAESAKAVNALAYAAGNSIVFAAGQYQPLTHAGKGLLAHELTHLIQQTGLGHAPATAIQRSPAKQVSCGKGPLTLPNGTVIDDPVGVITAAENRANELLDQAISELDFTRKQILAGATIGFPTISDGLASALKVMRIDPDDPKVWREPGGPRNQTVALLIKRLQLIRKSIGGGGFFFTCLGPATGKIGDCDGPICGPGAFAASCAGSFRMDLCQPFWTDDAPGQVDTILHESSHNFANFIVDSGSPEGMAACYARFAEIAGGAPAEQQTAEFCPDRA